MTWPSDDPAWHRESLSVATDLDHGGRWTSLRTGGREWLWTNPDAEVAAARPVVRPGAAFVDAGGVEECFPTVRGEPDHGDVWSRPWTGGDGEHRVRTGDLQLARRMHVDGALTVAYIVTGPPATPFVHAVHALLDVSPAARLHAPGVDTAHVLDHPHEGEVSVLPWPGPGWDRLGPGDGTATAAVLPGSHAVAVVDGADALVLEWTAAPAALLLWRNLGGWPAARPYRSTGVEPMAGTTATLGEPGPGRPARTGPDGSFRWELTVTAWRRA